MSNLEKLQQQEIINEVIAYAKLKVSTVQTKLISTFIQKYFANVGLDDLEERSIRDLCGAVVSHWKLVYQRNQSEVKIQVYNPHYERDGWQSTHTIVQLICDDMPFIVDSIRMELNRQGITTHLIIHLGGLKIQRSNDHKIEGIYSYHSNVKGAMPEAPVAMEIDRQTDPKTLQSIRENLTRVLRDVRLAVIDWNKMCQQTSQALADIGRGASHLDAVEIEESRAFLQWLLQDHFTFLGCRNYKLVGKEEQKALKIIPGSGLGVLRDSASSKVTRYLSELPPEARKLALSKQILIISKTNTKSTVHRPTYTDYIGVKRFDENGEVIGELRIIGLYTSDAYHGNPETIPVLRRKVEAVIEKSGWSRKSHPSKALLNILETLPRDDLFQASADELYELGMGILQLQERRKIRLFVYKDAYGRYISCLVFVPRDNFNTELLYRMQEILQKAFSGSEIAFTTQFTESVLARVHYVIRIDSRNPPKYDVKVVEKKLKEVGRSWKDGLRDSLLEYFGEEKGNMLYARYCWAFPASYREVFIPRSAVFDIEHIEKLSTTDALEMSFYRPLGASGSILRLKLFRAEHTVPLSDALPMLENMGLRVIGEQPHEIMLKDGFQVWINDFNMVYAQNKVLNIDEIREIFQQAFTKIWRGEAENDSFNRLVIEAKLNWRQISVLRAYAKYLRQINITFSQQYIEETFTKNPNAAQLLICYFNMRFNPEEKHFDKKLKSFEKKIQKELNSVANLDEDRILRHYLNIIKATIRTNYFQTENKIKPKPYLSFKFDPTKIKGLPLPYPMYEIFVYSPRFEGVHLRAAKVARGGIRWSDRREDFRTEILGLMKAQQVKNAVIVPSGAKGGFVAKNLPLDGSREAIMEEGIECYQNFIRGMLDVTDNFIAGKVVYPKNTVRYDDNDPYLVVAADKGTATFSDIANKIAMDYGFWLGDGFASGGYTGYDHKKMGITARGAWESVKRHFQELNINTQKNDITVIGIGDMSGDVFGNGMLLSKHIKLVAAFNHTHIFIDPNPNVTTSYKERQRLFNLPRSTWDDYDRTSISKGGGVYRRSAKSIKISTAAKNRLGLKKSLFMPNELIQAMLKAPVDLLWNGGIGTYVKANNELNSDVGDRTNDAVRINGNELRCRVVGEGGNLGLTQLGRIEYELHGGKINTDFIDNSAGVDCSDHEVNIKILLNQILINGELKEKQRNNILAQMQDEVAQLVLRNNYRQARAIGFALNQCLEYINLYDRYMTEQEQLNKLDRKLEFLPDDKLLLERKAAGKGLTRAEIAVLFAFSKIILKQKILASDLIYDSYLSKCVAYAFPNMIKQKFASYMNKHQLRHEIVATQLSNLVITEMSATFVYQMQDEANVTIPEIVKAYFIARNIYNMEQLLLAIESLDYKVSTDVQVKMMLEVNRLVRRATRWLLRNWRKKLEVSSAIAAFSGSIKQLSNALPNLLVGTEKENFNKSKQLLVDKNVPTQIAAKIASARPMYAALNIIEATLENKSKLKNVATIYFNLADSLDLVWFREHINAYPVDNRWSVLARAAFKGDLDMQQRILTVAVLKSKIKSKQITTKIETWFTINQLQIDRWRSILADLRGSSTLEFTMLSVAIRELFALAQGQ